MCILFEPEIPLPVIILRKLLWMGKNSPQRCFLQFAWEALPTTVIKNCKYTTIEFGSIKSYLAKHYNDLLRFIF